MKKYIRYFCGFIDTEQKWLNDMSSKGYRLVKTGKLIFEFEKCDPNKYQYYVDFVAHKSNSEVKKYKKFLEEIGYKVMTKNANLNWSFGKVRLRLYGKGSGKIATSSGNFNKEFLIIEKPNDGKSFELHTTVGDKIAYYMPQRNAYLSLFLLILFLFIWKWIVMGELIASTWLILVFSGITMIPAIAYQKRIKFLQKKSNINE